MSDRSAILCHDRSSDTCHNGHRGQPAISTPIVFEKSIPVTSPIVTGLANRSRVFEAFGEGEKLTINEVVERLNEEATPENKLSARTVRRSIENLVETGFLKLYGKQNNAMVYGKLSASFVDVDEKIIPFGGQLVSIEDFLKMVVDPDSSPLQKSKVRVISNEVEHHIRRRLAFVIMSAGNPGMRDRLHKVQRELDNVLNELNYAAGILQGFINTPVWYEQYRDKIAPGLRKVQETDPDLFQLSAEYVKGG